MFLLFAFYFLLFAFIAPGDTNQQRSESQFEAASNVHLPEAVSTSSSTQRHVLIVDDEDDIREIATLSLEMTEGWRVSAAESLRTGLELARTTHPDAIILDVMMPDMDGPTGLMHLRLDATTRDIPIIFLTAKAHEGEVRKLLDLGVNGVIGKPFDPITLGNRVREVLGWPDRATDEATRG